MINLTTEEMPKQEIEEVISDTALLSDEENNIVIHRMAITLLDMDNNRLITAKDVLEIEIENTPTFSDFFSNHIKSTRTSPKSKECKFDDTDANIITKIERYKRESSQDNVKTNDYFLKFANDVANLFFAKFKSTSSKSNGSLFVIEAAVGNADKIIFLKIDPQKGVQLNVIEEKLDDETKDIKVALKEILDVLPSDERSIHKSSIINIDFDDTSHKLTLNEEDTHLFVLDNQRSGDPSQFFIKDFLDATPRPDDEFKTMRAMDMFTDFLTTKFTSIGSHEISLEVSKQFPSHTFVELENIGSTLLKKFYQKNEMGEYITGEKDDNGNDILAPIDEEVDEFLTLYTSDNEEYSTGFNVVRNESKITYKGKQVLFRFDKVLENDKIIIKENKEDDSYVISIKGAKELGFGLDLK